MEMTYLLVGAAAVAAVAVAAMVLKKKPSAPAPAQAAENASAEAPQDDNDKTGDQALYALGLNPVHNKPIIYALTTCQHCKNTRKFLDENSVDYTVIYLDEYSTKQRAELMEKVRTYNPRGTFPTVLIPGGKVVIGFRKQLLKEALVK